jgi:prophage antirepressor-like protein
MNKYIKINIIYNNIMNTIIDLYNKLLVYNKNNISFIIDNTNIIWFKLADITNILEYKSRKDVIRDIIDKKYRKSLKNINTNQEIDKQKPDTVYITESGLYKLVIKSKMKIAEKFQEWLVEDALPKLRQYGYYQVDEKTNTKIKKLNHKISLLTKSNMKLKQNMVKNKYPKEMHFYVLKDDGMYKIGYTKNLTKRLATYNTGKANKATYSYYKKTDCAKEIEECMKALLNEYIYKSNKEFYNCTLNKILKEVRKCFKLEKSCKNCKDIQTGGGINNENYIIMSLLNDYKNKYNRIIKKYFIYV